MLDIFTLRLDTNGVFGNLQSLHFCQIPSTTGDISHLLRSLRFKEFPQFQSVVKASYNAVAVHFENVAILPAGTFAGPRSTEVLNAPQVACRHLSDLVFDVAMMDVAYDTSFSCRLFHDIVSHAFERGYDLGRSIRSRFRWQEVRGVLELLVPDGRHRQDLSCVGRTGL